MVLKRDLFANNEEIYYYAILVAAEKAMESPSSGSWNGEIWPDLRKWENAETENGTVLTYQTTPVKWEPFKNGYNTVKYTIGTGECDVYNYCNNPLKENYKYALKIRAFTLQKYEDSDVVYFETFEHLPVKDISLVLLGIFLTGAAAVTFRITHFDFMYFPRLFSRMKVRPPASVFLKSYSPRRFQIYANSLLQTEGRLSNEFHLLGTLSSNLTTLSLHGQRIDNREKNRYEDILPFDVTRVELSLINGDPTTDYINASFIRGYQQQIEYIATQGPKRETCRDFFRMIIEQKIQIIIMLTNLEENGVELCYKYYPELGCTFQFHDIQVCSEFEKDEGFCVRRKLKVKSEAAEVEVTHLHFEDWPDFKCPGNSKNLMELLECVRLVPHKGYMLVHGTAGTGRCGTFIALDILIQSIKNNDKISVFNTVLELRRQRVNMVQTLNQYSFIYKCISEAIVNFSEKNLVTQL